MENPATPLSPAEFIRAKHRSIFHEYLHLLRQEQAENPVRAEHIGKLYYARIIAARQTPPMNPLYVLRVINKGLRRDIEE